jgi:hypothetical protein
MNIFLVSIILLLGLTQGVREAPKIPGIVKLSKIIVHRVERLWTPRTYAKAYALKLGLTTKDWNCVDAIIIKESHWNPRAINPASGAYGLAQSLPAKKMAVEGADYRTNYRTQVRWLFRYLKYHWQGKPCFALRFHVRHGYY